MSSNSPRQFHETLFGYIFVGVLIAVLSWFIERAFEQRGDRTTTSAAQMAPANTLESQGATSQTAPAGNSSTVIRSDDSSAQRAQSDLEEFEAPGGLFRNEGSQWVEYKITSYGTTRFATFQEQARDADYVYLVDPSRQKPNSPNNAMLVRLPLSGGVAQWSYQNPIQWTDFTIVRSVK
jgi:hypothetical protein